MKFFTSFFVIVMAVCMIGMVGCTYDDESTPWIGGETGSTGSSGDTGTTGDTGDTGDTGAADLAGTWVSACFPYVWDATDPDEGHGTAKTVLEATATDMTNTITFYWNGSPDCEYALWEVVTEATYVIGDDITNASDETVTEIDRTIISQEETILDPSGGTATGFNSGSGTCQMTDWAFDVTKEITGDSDCVPLPPSVGDVVKEVFQMQSDTTFLYGEPDAAPYGDAREEELTELLFTKQ